MSDELERIIRLTVDDRQALSALDKLAKSTANIDKSMQGLAGSMQKNTDLLGAINTKINIAGAFEIAKEVFTGVVNGIQSVIDKMDDLGNASASVGVSVEALQGMQYAFVGAGISATQTTQALGRLADQVADIGDETKKSSQILKQFGVTAGDTADEAIRKIADGFAATADGANKVAAATELFGRELGRKMIPALNQGADAIKAASDEMKELAGITEQDAAMASEFNAKWERFATLMSGLGTAIAREALPPLIKFLDTATNGLKDVMRLMDQVDEFMGRDRGKLTPLFDPFGIATAKRESKEMEANLKSLSDAYQKTVASFGEQKPQLKLPGWLDDFNGQVKKGVEEASRIPAKIQALQEQISNIDTSTPEGVAKFQYLNKQLESLRKNIEITADKAGKTKIKAPKLDDWDKWLKSLDASVATLDALPLKLAHLQTEMAKMAAAGDTTSNRFQAFKKAADQVAAALDPVAAALQKVTQAATEQEQAPKILAAMEDRMIELAFAGQTTTAEFKLLAEQVQKMREQMDSSGATKLVNSLIAAEKEAGNLQAKFDAINKALDAGLISAATADKTKNELLGISDAANKVTKDVKTLSESIGEMGAKFVVDFADKLIDSFGQVDTSFGDMVESMIKQMAKLILNSYFQQFFKAVEDMGGWGKAISAFSSSFSQAAKGAAFNAKGMQFFASGGIVTRPTMFAHGGGLGVMGERGAEAIVPLRRDSSGDLGVAAGATTVNVYNNADVEVETTSRDNTDGSRIIDITIERKVKAMFNSGQMDRTMRSTYGVTRQPAMG